MLERCCYDVRAHLPKIERTEKNTSRAKRLEPQAKGCWQRASDRTSGCQPGIREQIPRNPLGSLGIPSSSSSSSSSTLRSASSLKSIYYLAECILPKIYAGQRLVTE